MWIYVALILLVIWAIVCTGYAWHLHKKLSATNKNRAFYYETSDWFDGRKGVKYANDDEEMDSILYLPHKNKVMWFKGRKIAEVQPSGTFTIKFANGGRLGGLLHVGDKQVELFGLTGTSEENITETMILNE